MIDFDAPPLSDVLEILLRGLDIKDLADVKPRAKKKNSAEKIFRTRSVAEVFTPSHLVKFMVDALDDGQLDTRWLEVACGEAPFITNRYDAETGEDIPPEKRTGILDRKLRAAKNFSEVKRAVQSVYGFEIQDDSLLIARANVLLSAVEAVKNFSPSDLAELAEIVTWNFFLFDGTRRGGRKFVFGGSAMGKKFFVISNPPYQEETAYTSDKPVYHEFMNLAEKISDKAVFVTPARFLFNAGKTPKDFNRCMLDDPHFKVLDYTPDASKYFRGVEIKGGVAVTMRDDTKNFGAIGMFIPFVELESIHKKVCVDDKNFRPLNEIFFAQCKWVLEKLYADHPEYKSKIGSGGNECRLTTNIFERLPEIFFDNKPDGDYVQILGLMKMERVYKWIHRDYLDAPESLDKYKVFVPKANGSRAIGKVPTSLINKPILGAPSVGCTQTFITVGAFDTRAEAEACLTYIKSKFARVMLGILKVTQDNTAERWAKVPLQDFSSASDIDWRKPVDAQLYRKYKLSAAEISFNESHVKAME